MSEDEKPESVSKAEKRVDKPKKKSKREAAERVKEIEKAVDEDLEKERR